MAVIEIESENILITNLYTNHHKAESDSLLFFASFVLSPITPYGVFPFRINLRSYESYR
jgi:hypothetical protein